MCATDSVAKYTAQWLLQALVILKSEYFTHYNVFIMTFSINIIFPKRH